MSGPVSRQSLLLTERVASFCRLAAADLEFLLVNHRSHVEVRPTRESGVYQLRPRGHVGVINTPGARLSIRPKIPLRNLYYLLDGDAVVDFDSDASDGAEGTGVTDMLAARLAHLMRQRARQGLHHDYVHRPEQGPQLQGKLDVAEHLRAGPARRDRLSYEYQDFTSSIAVNQIPKATAEWLLATPLLGAQNRQELRTAVNDFREVDSLPPQSLDPASWPATNGATRSYQPLLDLCRLLVEGLRASGREGTSELPSFLLCLESAFESFCTRQVAGALAGPNYRVLSQETAVPHTSGDGLPDLRFRPDILITSGSGKGLLVMDAKWKTSPFVRADFNQVLAYCAALGVSRGMLICPGRRNRTWRYHFPASDITVFLQRLNVQGDLPDCQEAVARWLGKLHKLCDSAVTK